MLVHMFTVTCPGHGGEVLLPESRVRLHNMDPGILAVWTCTCGTEGAFLTGRHAATA